MRMISSGHLTLDLAVKRVIFAVNKKGNDYGAF